MPITFEPKDAIALVGVAASLGVGIRNWIVTTSIRTGTIRLEEFRSQIREPIQAKVEKLGEIKESLLALQRPNALKNEELAGKVEEQLATLEFVVDDLCTLFQHADRSAFAGGNDWAATYSPRLEEAVGRLGPFTAARPLNRVDLGGALSEVTRTIVDVTDELRLRFEQEVRGLVPSGLLGRTKSRVKVRS